ncbi:pep-cterm sorting domain-containing protein [Anaeramoeba ignava]|uniref:Pep-cterm sorting domain-containing protein n=1 Tax=Anaeramoeba ignava TaxID=1746090 RepID=A0A9Q0LPU3_ANAIG|nr:pep-cterm sorting domain-containing protein [Anaeramoeba ignava]
MFFNNLANLSENLAFLLDQKQETYSDFEIICKSNEKDTTFKCHKAILAARNEYFRKLFSSNSKEYQEGKIFLEDASNSTVSVVLNYLYTGKIGINSENAFDIYLFSTKYSIQDLEQQTLHFFEYYCTVKTVVEILKFSQSNNLSKLTDFCFEFISTHFDEFIKTPFFYELEEPHLDRVLSNDILKTDEIAIYQALIRWGRKKINSNMQYTQMKEKDKESLKDCLSNLHHKIRFVDFSKSNFEKVLQLGLVPNNISQQMDEFLSWLSIIRDDAFDEFIDKFKQEKAKDFGNTLIFQSRTRWPQSEILNKKYFQKLREWIPDSQFLSKMKLGFSTSQNGWNSQKWHQICDNKGKSLVIVKTTQGFIFGGFSQYGWTHDKSKWYCSSESPFNWIKDPNAFVFSLKNHRNSSPKKFTLNPKKAKFAVGLCFEIGPAFGDAFLIHPNLKIASVILKKIYSSSTSSFLDSKDPSNYFIGNDKFCKVEILETFFL